MSASPLKVGILGVTGAVGQMLLQILNERDFPISELRVFASPRSVGDEIPWRDQVLICQELSKDNIQGLDLLLSSAGSKVSAEWVPKFAKAGVIVVDNTSYFRMDDDVPLVIPEINADALLDHKGVIANPNCTSIALLMATAPIHKAVGISRMSVATYQSVSGSGRLATDELTLQSRQALDREAVSAAHVYPHQVAFNVIPQVERFTDDDGQLVEINGVSGYTTEEIKMMLEPRKILQLDTRVGITVTCARVPVMNGHSLAVNLQTDESFTPEQYRQVLEETEGVEVIDNPEQEQYPMALSVSGQDAIQVGRIRIDPSQPRGLNCWVCGDNLRKGAAVNTVQIAEELVKRGLLF